MQYRVYNRQNLTYVDGGYVESWSIDDDYVVNNNSTINVVKKTGTYESRVYTIANIEGRNYYANTTTSTVFMGLLEFVGESGAEYVIPLLVSTDKTAVTYWQDYNYEHMTYSGEIEWQSSTFYYSATDYAMQKNQEGTVDVTSDYNLQMYDSVKALLEDNVKIYAPISDLVDTLTNVVVGDVVALIDDNGLYHKGVITAVDDTARTISYKSDKELFNDNIYNPLATDYENDSDLEIAGAMGLDGVVEILKSYFVDTKDTYKALPIVFQTVGNNDKILWTWDNDSISLVDWLTELFEKYNVSVSWTISFDVAQTLAKRSPKYVVTISAITNDGGIVKDNVTMQTITYTEQELPEATVCIIIDSSTKEYVSTFYLVEKNGEYSVTEEIEPTDGRKRVLPVKTVVCTWDSSSDDTTTTAEDVATDKLISSQFNQAIEIKISADSKMFDFSGAQFGDLYTIVNERGTISSVFTGKKAQSSSKWITLYFGIGRQNYTDLIQVKMRKQRKIERYH